VADDELVNQTAQGDHGRFGNLAVFECDKDADAISPANAHEVVRPKELLQQSRIVAKFPAQKPATRI